MPPVVELQQVRGGGLRGVDLRVEPGERVGVVGLAGSGASSVVPLVVGTAEPDAGRVVREGRDVTGRPVGDRPGGLGWVGRAPHPFSGLSVYENVLVAALANRRWRRRFAEAHARRAVLRLGLADLADVAADELDAEGRCRLEVARVVTAPRRMVAVDHLAEGLQPGVRAELALALAEVAAAGAAVLWADAADQPPPGVDRLVVLAQGRVVADGPRHEVLAGDELRGLALRPEGPASRHRAPVPSARPVLVLEGWRWDGGSPGAGADLVLGEGELVLASSALAARPRGLVRSLAGLEHGEGGLDLDGADLASRRARTRAAQGLGFVPRSGGVDPASTVADHLALGRGTGRRGPWTSSALLTVMPELAPLRDEAVGELVALERRLASIARALAGNPIVLVVEDPLADLDERAGAVVADALAEVSRRTPVLVSGPAGGPLARRASRVVDLDATPTGGPPTPTAAAGSEPTAAYPTGPHEAAPGGAGGPSGGAGSEPTAGGGQSSATGPEPAP
ncbi:MAG: ATP-binding cassette domain-containing protein [Acidimicrobiia bacterium]|nr:ATP-binding cassette domain-containing protein [Acidimicrobiia bacterium]